jgi:DNA-binding NarL/FixJ family response regulator
MTILDIAQFEAARHLFPELSETQCLVALLFSAGLSVKEIASLRDISPSTVNNTLSTVKEKFELPSLCGVRCVIMLRLMLRGLVVLD